MPFVDKKTRISHFITAFSSFIMSAIFATPSFAQEVQKSFIGDNWEFKLSSTDNFSSQAVIDTSKWYPAKVPGGIHTDLFNNDLIEDPFWETNEQKLQWIEWLNWDYKTSFDLDSNLLTFRHVEIIFEGLDTYADVFVNGHKVIAAVNMFRAWQADIRPFLIAGNNELLVKFRSPLLENKEKVENYPYKLPSGNETVDLQVGSFTRKAAYHFGWDWGPRFVGCGIWRPVSLLYWNDVKITDIFCRTALITAEEAIVNIKLEIEADNAQEQHYKISLNGQSQQFTLQSGRNIVEFEYKISEPELWWPNGLGEAFLYQFDFALLKDKVLKDKSSQKFGLRTIKLINEPDEIGTSYYFEVNGKPVFMKGANYIPQDIFLPEVTPERYEKLIFDAKDANMNMLRVWGGGIYENDLFYDLCDQYGLLVWQDFMFAGSLYPDSEDFKKNVTAEIDYNIKRIRNHACLALWCGNNEIEVAWKNWGWQKTFGYSPKDSVKIWNNYTSLFQKMIPERVAMFDPDRQYVSTSPLSNWGTPENFNHSSMHYWGVWHGKEPFAGFNTNVGRFMVEYGFQSFPEMETIKKFASDSSFSLDSPTMKNRQKSYIGNGMIKTHTERWFGKSKNFGEFVEWSQKVQAEGIKMAIKAHRKNKPHCMGTLYWQLNDCWPGPSWSSIDYYGRHKPLMEVVKKFYQPVIAVMDLTGDEFEILVVSDELNRVGGQLIIKLYTFKKELIRDWQVDFSVPENSVIQAFKIKTKKLLRAHNKQDVYVDLKVISKNEVIFTDSFYFVHPKDFTRG